MARYPLIASVGGSVLAPLVALALAMAVIGEAAAVGAQIVEPGSNPQSWGYNPPSLTVTVGDTITWTNNGFTNHTVTADDGKAFDSGSVAPRGGTFSFRATTAGTIAYHCSFHPWMKGTLVVKAAAPAAPTATPAPPPTATPAPAASAGGTTPAQPTPAPAAAPSSQAAPTPTALPRTGGLFVPAGLAGLVGLGLATVGGLMLRRPRRSRG